MENVSSDEAGLERTAAILNAGGVAVIPTDTVYGLAAHPRFPAAVERLYTIKARSAMKPIALLAADAAAAARFLGGLDAPARDAATRYWPGALTLVLPVKTPGVAVATEGLRVPDHDWTRRLLARCGGVLRVTSANMSGCRPATDAADALAEVGLSADVTVDDGVSPGGEASTVVRLTAAGEWETLRPGPVLCWRLHARARTASTNLDARDGRPGDVFTAEEQTAGRGRADHVWHARPGENLTFSAVLDVAGLAPDAVATLPLVVGLSVVEGLKPILGETARGLAVKWPNDVLLDGRKLCGCLCERDGDRVIAGIGLNVNQCEWSEPLRRPATSLRLALGHPIEREGVLRRILSALAANHFAWRKHTFAALLPRLAEHDALKGLDVRVIQTDDDAAPRTGRCGGIRADGALDVDGSPVYAGEVQFGGRGGT